MSRFKTILAAVLVVALLATQVNGLAIAGEYLETEGEVAVQQEATENQEGTEAEGATEAEDLEFVDETFGLLSADDELSVLSGEVSTMEATVLDSGNCGPSNNATVKWTLYDDGRLVVSPGTGTVHTMNNYSDGSMTPWYKHKGKITHFIVADGVTNVGNYVFGFRMSTSSGDILAKVTLADSVTSIGNFAFNYCYSLAEVNLSNSLVSIGNNAFVQNNALTNIDLPASLKTIGDSAFLQNNGLKRWVLPAGLESIGAKAFSYTDSYGVDYIRVEGGDPNAIFELPSGIKTLGAMAFDRIFNRSVLGNGYDQVAFKVPASVTSVGKEAFYFSTNTLQYPVVITVESTNLAAYADLALKLSNDNKNCVIVFADETTRNTFYNTKVSTSSIKTNAAYSWPVTAEFYAPATEPTPVLTEPKVANASISYALNTSGGYWYFNSSYALPDASTVPVGPGYEPNWVYYPSSPSVPVAVSTATVLGRSDPVKIYMDGSLVDPTVTGTLEGEYYTDGVRSGARHNFSIDVPDNRLNQLPNAQVGLFVDHPLLKGDPADGHYGTDADGYVYFKYFWIDVEYTNFGGGASGPSDGSRRSTYPFQFSGAGFVNDDSITIRSANDYRDKNTGTDWYEIVVIGYYVNSNGVEKEFYMSSNSGISFTGANNIGATDSTVFNINVKGRETTVTFDLGGGEVSGDDSDIVWKPLYNASSIGYNKLGDYPLANVPEPEYGSKVLIGWKDLATGAIVEPDDMDDYLILAGTIVNPGEGVLWNQTFEAQWDERVAITYKYTLDEGATWITYTGFSNQSAAGKALPDSLIVRPAENPSINGYDNFDGWYKEEALTNEWDYTSDKIGTSSITLYASLEPITYKITYLIKVGTTEPVETAVDEYTVADLDITLNAPTKVGAVFTGWTVVTDPAGTGGKVVYADGVIKDGTYGDLIVTASYTLAEVQVTYKEGFGSNNAYTGFLNEAAASSGTYTGELNRPIMSETQLNPTRTGWTFAGWKQMDKNLSWVFAGEGTATTLIGDSGVVADASTPPNYTLVLEAQWTINEYTLTFDSQGAVEADELDILELDVEFDSIVEDATGFPATPTHAGNYDFEGWRLPDGTMLDENTTMPAKDTLLTAVWVSNGTPTISANDFSHNYDTGNFTASYTRTMAQVIVYDDQGVATNEFAQISSADLARLNAARDALAYSQTVQVTVTFTSALGPTVDVVVTIYRGAAPVTPEPPVTPPIDPPVTPPVTPTEPTVDPDPDPEPTPDPDEPTPTPTPTPGTGTNTNNGSTTGTTTETPAEPADEGFFARIFGATQVPLGDIGSHANWSLLSLILVVTGAIIALAHLIIGLLRRNRKEEDEGQGAETDAQVAYVSAHNAERAKGKKQQADNRPKRAWTAMRAVAMVIGAIVVFLLIVLEDFTLDPGWVNQWTIIFVVLFVAELFATLVHVVLSRKKNEDEDDERAGSNAAGEYAQDTAL